MPLQLDHWSTCVGWPVTPDVAVKDMQMTQSTKVQLEEKEALAKQGRSLVSNHQYVHEI